MKGKQKMILDKNNKLINSLDFRGTKLDFLQNLSAKDSIVIVAEILKLVSRKESFKARDLAPTTWKGTSYEPLFKACNENLADAKKLFGVLVKQALIMTPLLFTQESAENDFDAVTYTRV